MQILLRARIAPPGATPADKHSGPRFGRSWRAASTAAFVMLLFCAAVPSSALAVCGDGLLDAGEQCDDRDTQSNDGCSSTCVIEAGFNCSSTPGSPSLCTPICGDGLVRGSERCDDGGTSDNPEDGCDRTCRIDRGWQCSGSPSSCTEVCGNGIVTPGEGCDPGLDVNGDCCSASCQLSLNGTVCRAASGACDEADTCNGSSAACPDAKKVGTVCRGSGGFCDVEERCDGFSNDCPANAFAPASLECRIAGGACDAAERCTGLSAVCPGDVKRAAGTTCRGSLSACDPAETCDGVNNACPAQGPAAAAGTPCRDSAGACDAAEVCNGSSIFCPADAKLGDVCDDLSPTPGASCAEDEDCQDATHPNGGCEPTVCRSPSDACDQPEVCDGENAACPSERTCTAGPNRDAACTVDGDCPNSVCGAAPLRNAFFVCREAAGGCDLAERCNGSTAQCPVDLKRPPTTVCRRAAGGCDVEDVCNGVSTDCPDAVRPAGFTCRNFVDAQCDFDDTCDGVDKGCTNNQQPNLTPCPDADFCNGDEVCLFGRCNSPASGPCVGGTCEEATDQCVVCGDGLLAGTEQCGETGAAACPVGQVCSGCRCVAPGPQLQADRVCGSLGDSLAIPVSLTSNGELVSSLGFTLTFPNTLVAPDNTLFAVTCSTAVADLGFNCQGLFSGRNVQVVVSPPVGPLPVPTIPDGEVVVVRLQVRETADAGALTCSSLECQPLELTDPEFGDPAGQPIGAGSAVEGCADVVGCTQGDCNGNNNVTTADVTCTIQRIFGQTDQTSPCEDCNGDGNLSSADVTCDVLCIFGACPARP